jgi:6-phosphofructokinase 1
MKRIAVLTSGGDSPGMNTCLAHLFTLCSANNMQLVGVKQGYIGLIENNNFVITKDHIKNIYNIGGSILKTGRSEEFLTKAGRQKAVNNLKENDIHCLVVIGGNGSFRGAQKLADEGVNVIAVPGTIDNDLNYSEKSLGFDTAVNNSVSAIDKIKDTMLSNNRGVVVEVMGRRSGDIALYAASASNADVVVVKEVPKTVKEVTEYVLKAIKKGVDNPTVVVSENILNTTNLAKQLEKASNKPFKTTVLGYIQRGGKPTVFDRNYAMELAVKTIKLIEENLFSRAIGVKNGQIYHTNLSNVLTMKTNYNFQLHELFKKLND